MKVMKRIATLLLAAFLVAGVFAPVSTEAATGPSCAGIKFYSWSGQGNVLMVTRAQNIRKFQYEIYSDSMKLTRRAYSWNYVTKEQFDTCKVTGVPKLACCYVRVRAQNYSNQWGAWSRKIPIIPLLGNTGTIKVTTAGNMKAKLAWSKVNGATDYLVYMSTNGKTGWKKVATVKGNAKSRSVVISSFNGKKLVKYQNYYYKVIVRKKIGGKYYHSNGNSNNFYYGYFWLYTTYAN